MNDLVSIILPMHNARAWIQEAVDSVLAQDHDSWELLVIDNGSSDGSADLVRAMYSDERIRILPEGRKGVSAARNKGLDHARGAYICFLDADDRLPAGSLSSRLASFRKRPELSFVDGRVLRYTADFSEVLDAWTPRFEGAPTDELAKMTGSCFRGITWMLRAEVALKHRFPEGQSHGEDLSYYLAVSAEGGSYAYTSDEVYDIRVREGSAMSSLEGQLTGFREIRNQIGHLHPAVQAEFNKKAQRILWRSYLKKGRVVPALRILFSGF